MMGYIRSSGESVFAQMCRTERRQWKTVTISVLIVKIAQLYYEQDMTQAQLRANWNYRTTISRL